MSYDDSEDLKERKSRREHRGIMCLLVAASVATLLTIAAIWSATWHATDNNGRTDRDRIAACAVSNDVVGCLKESR